MTTDYKMYASKINVILLQKILKILFFNNSISAFIMYVKSRYLYKSHFSVETYAIQYIHVIRSL